MWVWVCFWDVVFKVCVVTLSCLVYWLGFVCLCFVLTYFGLGLLYLCDCGGSDCFALCCIVPLQQVFTLVLGFWLVG